MSSRDLNPLVAPTAAEISRDEILRRLRDPTLVILNVLPRKAYDEGHIPGSLSLPVPEVRRRASEVLPDRSREIAVYCGGGA